MSERLKIDYTNAKPEIPARAPKEREFPEETPSIIPQRREEPQPRRTPEPVGPVRVPHRQPVPVG